MSKIYFLLTANCNLSCGHCYGSFGPGGRTMGKTQIETALRNLPKETTSLCFSGGEVTTRMEELRFALQFVQEHRDLFPNAKVTVETNGTWALDRTRAFNMLNELTALGVSQVSFGSWDKYHLEQGFETYRLRNDGESELSLALMDLSQQKHKKIGLLFRGGNQILPIGRGINVPADSHIDHYCDAVADHRLYPPYGGYTINPDGEVFPCCWQITPAISSILDHTLEEIHRKALQDKIFSMLLRFGPSGVATTLGLSRAINRVISEKDNMCQSCISIFARAKEQGLI